ASCIWRPNPTCWYSTGLNCWTVDPSPVTDVRFVYSCSRGTAAPDCNSLNFTGCETMPRIAAFLLCSMMTLAAHAEVYRWTDANGSIHFSDTPPNLQEHDRVTVREPVTVPLSANILQSEKVRQSRQAIERMLEPENKHGSAQTEQANESWSAQCEKYQRQLELIQTKLRAGYSNDRDNSFRQTRRQVSQLHSIHGVLE